MDYKSLYAGKNNFGKILFDEKLKFHTNFGIGGPCDVFVEPENEEELIALLKFNKENNIQTTVIGNGTNLLATDKGVRGCLVCLSKNYDKIEIDGEHVKVLSGTALSKCAKKSFEYSLSGMEEISGIPGSVGGAIAMNAGAYGGEIKNILVSARCVDKSGQVSEFTNEEMHFAYRHSRVFEQDLIVSSVVCKLKKGDKDKILEKFNDYNNRRISKQPLEKKSAGSTFKRPVGSFASKLIDECGLRGYKMGDCQVSEKHCGFIINNGEATFEEMKNFIDEVSRIVYEKTSFKLEREVKILGEE